MSPGPAEVAGAPQISTSALGLGSLCVDISWSHPEPLLQARLPPHAGDSTSGSSLGQVSPSGCWGGKQKEGNGKEAFLPLFPSNLSLNTWSWNIYRTIQGEAEQGHASIERSSSSGLSPSFWAGYSFSVSITPLQPSHAPQFLTWPSATQPVRQETDKWEFTVSFHCWTTTTSHCNNFRAVWDHSRVTWAAPKQPALVFSPTLLTQPWLIRGTQGLHVTLSTTAWLWLYNTDNIYLGLVVHLGRAGAGPFVYSFCGRNHHEGALGHRFIQTSGTPAKFQHCLLNRKQNSNVKKPQTSKLRFWDEQRAFLVYGYTLRHTLRTHGIFLLNFLHLNLCLFFPLLQSQHRHKRRGQSPSCAMFSK